jgi:TRAP-type C4-dicarboxylate transport system permease small subunit
MPALLLAGWRHLTEGVAAVSFALMFAAFIIQIISRYVFDMPVAWSLELCAIGYVWVVFWSCNLIVPPRQQIVFDVLYQALPPAVRRIIAVFNYACLFALFLAAVPATLEYIWFLRRRHSMMLSIPMNIVYFCFAVFMVAVVVTAAIQLYRLFSRSWRQHL